MLGSPVDAFAGHGMCHFISFEALVTWNPDNAGVWGKGVDAFQKLYRSCGNPSFHIVACRSLGVGEDHDMGSSLVWVASDTAASSAVSARLARIVAIAIVPPPCGL